MALNKYKLGRFIEKLDNKNSDLKYGVEYAVGVSNEKELMPTKADLNGRNLAKFSIIYPGDFVYNHRTSRHGDKFCIAYNTTQENLICTEDYTIFRIKDDCKNKLLNEYLYMFFHRPEMDRFVMYSSWGSSTEFFNWDDVCDIDIELPDLATQQKYVDIYKAMVANQQSYECGLDNLKFVCDGYIEDLKTRCPKVKIADVSWLSDKRNEEETCTNVKGLTVYKKFIDTKANMDGVPLHNYKMVERGDIGYVPTTNRNGNKIACGLADEPCIISSTYEVLKINKEKCLPEYLFLWFARTEMDRYARYNSWGSAREVIDWDALGNYAIPLPTLDVQQAIVDIYNIYITRKAINEQLRLQIKDICPILIQGSLEEGRR